MALGWGKAIAAALSAANYIAGIFATRQKQVERDRERATGAALGNLDAAEKGMAIADDVAKDLAEQSTDEETDAKALAVARRRRARKR